MESRYPGHPTYPLALLNFIAQFFEVTEWLLRQLGKSLNWASVPVTFQTMFHSPTESLRLNKTIY